MPSFSATEYVVHSRTTAKPQPDLGRSEKTSGRPVRYLLNNSRAIAAHGYPMLYLKQSIAHIPPERPELKPRVWQLLISPCPDVPLRDSRVYGAGLPNLEPKELSNVPGKEIAELISSLRLSQLALQSDLLKDPRPCWHLSPP